MTTDAEKRLLEHVLNDLEIESTVNDTPKNTTSSEKRMKQRQAQSAIYSVIEVFKRKQVDNSKDDMTLVPLNEYAVELLGCAYDAIDELLALECAINEAPQKITPVDLPVKPAKEESEELKVLRSIDKSLNMLTKCVARHDQHGGTLKTISVTEI